MYTKRRFFLFLIISLFYGPLFAQQINMPINQFCTKTLVEAGSEVVVKIPQGDQMDDGAPREIVIKPLDIKCQDFGPPEGDLSVEIRKYNSQNVIVETNTYVSTLIEQLITTRTKYQPSAFATGYCNWVEEIDKGCRYWVMFVDNKNSDEPDVVSVVILQGDGSSDTSINATGTVVSGDFTVVNH